MAYDFGGSNMPMGGQMMGPPDGAVDADVVEDMLVRGEGATPDVNPSFTPEGEQKMTGAYNEEPPQEMESGNLGMDSMAEGGDREAMHSALVEQHQQIQNRSQNYQDKVIEENKKKTSFYNA